MKRLSILMVGMAFSPVLHAENMMDAYREAQSHDAVFASAKAAHRAGLEKLPQGRALLLPSVNLSADTTENSVKREGAARTNYNSYGYTLALSQPIFRKQNFAQYEQSKQQVTQAEAQLAIAKQDLILRVAQAYFDALLAQDNVAFASSYKTAISEQLAQAKRNFEVGTATITDTHEAQARFDLATSQEIAARNDLEVKKFALQKVIGKIPSSLSRLSDKLPLKTPEPNDMEQWVASSEQQNLQFQIQQAAFEIANQEVERNRGGHYPTLDVVASYRDANNTNLSFGIGGNTQSTAIGLQLNLPIFSGGSTSSKVREAVANQDKAREDLEDTRRQVVLQTRQAFLGVTSGEAQVRALEQALVSTQSSLDSTKLGFEVGVRTSVDVLNAQQQLFSAKRDLSQARYTYIMNQLKLKSAVGTLGEADLEQVNSLLAQAK
ncbi:TolC family outer membrane protein [Sulfurirhabdus autotrophica]|uniref:Outer membrane protein n=1 Tax=Sulfurirhabdus autotrophica TaxID=1706046 RepID=A0A4R3Y2H7_9PROT|nr:TolC family outer membrane protein [Sulfurirhabdus autotrophica]TCV84243.1 outer membrane protein [Sulfurirhabdus autotrophica]